MQTVELAIAIGSFILMLFAFLHESCAYWILEDDRIIFRQMFGRRKVVLRNVIISIQKQSIDMQIFIPCDEYVIESPQGTIRIVINSTNRKLLEEYFGL